jgi:Rad3-related DNA helicase
MYRATLNMCIHFRQKKTEMAVYYNYSNKRRDLVVNNSSLFLVDPVFKYPFGDRLSSLQDFV